jgi:putative Mg2+ transporter-C (MgtC) family protein
MTLGAMSNTEGALQIGELALAFGLSAIIGAEREMRQKSAGLRTHSLVGLGSALFVLISKYAFTDVTIPKLVVLDPSRVAAQIVTGIGFIGAGLIFVRRDSVVGLTTAAAIWVTAAVGAAAGGGLPLIAAVGTAAYLVITVVFRPLTRLLPTGPTTSMVRVRYEDGRGVLRSLLARATAMGFTVADLATEPQKAESPSPDDSGPSMVDVTLHVHGRASPHDLAVTLSEIAGVASVKAVTEVDPG